MIISTVLQFFCS